MGNNNGGSKFLTGFMWGAIIGGGLAFLLGTKKGKKILKAISEEGFGLSELLNQEKGLEDEEDEEIVPEEPVFQNPKVEKKENSQDSIQSNGSSTISKIIPSGKRFFRGVPRKS